MKDKMIENKLGLTDLSKHEIKKIAKIDDDYCNKFVEYHK